MFILRHTVYFPACSNFQHNPFGNSLFPLLGNLCLFLYVIAHKEKGPWNKLTSSSSKGFESLQSDKCISTIPIEITATKLGNLDLERKRKLYYNGSVLDIFIIIHYFYLSLYEHFL
jgi:hypothetical protein